MDDRELLELAAKAAGIHCKGWAMPGGRSDGWHGMYTGSDDDVTYVRWNPLTDDGDALRLAVKLGLAIYPAGNGTGCAPEGQEKTAMRYVKHDPDPYAATRRAIVRAAAAEIGKGTKPFPTAEEIREEWT